MAFDLRYPLILKNINEINEIAFVPGAKSRAGMMMSEVALAHSGPDLFQACRFPRRRVLSRQWQSEFCPCSIDVVGGKQCDGCVDHLERFRHNAGRKRANQ